METQQEQNRKIKSPDGVDIAYSITHCPGATHTLVMLHGLASNQSRWFEFLNKTVLTSRINLLRMDLRGHGHSMSYGYIGHPIWQQDLSAILRQESLDKVILAGHSMGAQLALHFTVSHSTKVEGLVLIDPTLPKKLKGWLAFARRLRYPLWLVIVIMRQLHKLKPQSKTYPYRDLYKLDKQTRELMVHESADIIADLYTSPTVDLKYIPLINYLQDVYATTGPLPELSKIQCPVCILLSKGSSIVDATNIKDYFSMDKVLDIIEIDANHWPLTEKPEETKRAIEEWCLKQIT